MLLAYDLTHFWIAFSYALGIASSSPMTTRNSRTVLQEIRAQHRAMALDIFYGSFGQNAKPTELEISRITEVLLAQSVYKLRRDLNTLLPFGTN